MQELLADLPSLHKLRLLRLNSLEKFVRRFVIAVLGHEPPADGEVEYGLVELLDLVRPGGEAREVTDVEAGVLAEGGRGSSRF